VRFYGYFRSSAAYRCRIAFNLKGVEPDFVPVHLRRGEQKKEAYCRVNPQGLVPALAVDSHVLTQSLAIIEWLDETHPQPPLLPHDPIERAKVRVLALTIACDVHPLQNLRVLNYLKSEFDQDQSAVDRWCRHWIESGLRAAEARVTSSGKVGPFCFGDTPGLADICLVAQMFSADRFGCDLKNMPTLSRIAAACEAHPAFAKAHPARQPDAEE
jgi:maleylacetoacetate isomerase